MSHFKATVHKILFPASVRPSVRLLDGDLTHSLLYTVNHNISATVWVGH